VRGGVGWLDEGGLLEFDGGEMIVLIGGKRCLRKYGEMYWWRRNVGMVERAKRLVGKDVCGFKL
jgi:hypothetical protein